MRQPHAQPDRHHQEARRGAGDPPAPDPDTRRKRDGEKPADLPPARIARARDRRASSGHQLREAIDQHRIGRAGPYDGQVGRGALIEVDQLVEFSAMQPPRSAGTPDQHLEPLPVAGVRSDEAVDVDAAPPCSEPALPSGTMLGMSQLVTGEAVPVELRVARIGSRVPATLLDFTIQLVLGVVLAVALRPVLSSVDAALQAAIVLAAFVFVILGYPILLETLWGGRTIGKWAMGLRVLRDDGGPIRFRHALVRALLGALVEKPGISLGLVAIFCSMLNVQAKRLGDILAGTVVVHTRVPQTMKPISSMPPELAGWAVTLDLSRLGDDLALACRQFLGRAASLTPPARERLGGELVAAVAATVTPAPPVGTPGWAYLTAVLAERRRRDEQRRTSNAPAAWAGTPPTVPWTPPAAAPAGADRGPYREPEPQLARAPEPPGPFAPPA